MARISKVKKGSVIAAPKQAQASFEAKPLLKVLNAAYLSGAIEELVLTVADGIGTIAAVDKTSCVFAFSQGPVGSIKDAKIGLKETGFFIKAVGAAGSEKIEFQIEDERWFKIDIPNSGEIKILLTAPDMIPTAVADYSAPIEKMREAATIEILLEKAAVDKFLYFQDLVKNTTTMVEISKGKLTIGSGKYETRTFKVDFGSVQEEDMVVIVFGEFLKAVLSVLDWSEDAEQPMMYLGVGAPLLIEQGEGALWSLSPSSEGGA